MKKYLSVVFFLAMSPLAMAQVDTASSDWEGTRYEEQAAYERAIKEADRLAREADKADRGGDRMPLRFELDLPFGIGSNSYLSHGGSEYSNHKWDIGATALFHLPLNYRWELAAGAGFRFSWYHFHNSVQFDTATLLMTGYTPTDWHSYSCGTITRSVVVPLRVAVVTNRKTEIYLGCTFAYDVSNSFYYAQVGLDDEVHNIGALDMNNIDAFRKLHIELAVGMSWPLWWIFSGGWELYYGLTPTFDTGIQGTPSIHEFGVRVTL